ncbi:MAG: hypothetical protein H7Y31_14075 [Chitinophagaceae bacterium]|nr:hypothetical protein [Chitinophagaceae bacterium]
MRSSRLFLFLLALGVTSTVLAQDLTGTWEGQLKQSGEKFGGIERTFKLRWEIVQIEKEVFGIVYFYPQDTRPSDEPNSRYNWYGKLGTKKNFPFQFIRAGFIDGRGRSTTFQFNVNAPATDSLSVITGNWYAELESLNSLDPAAGQYTLHRVSNDVSDGLWLKRKEKEIIDKLSIKEPIRR